MKHLFSILLIASLFVTAALRAQDNNKAIERVIVETYYIADVNDAAATGGRLPEGAVTYRIFLDLAKGASLSQLYGDANHRLKITSTANFYNDSLEGKCFAYDILNRSIRTNNWLALDSYLTLGAASRGYFGVLKVNDGDATSALQELKNEIAAIGVPLTKQDGFLSSIKQPSYLAHDFHDIGDINVVQGDSTVFGQHTGAEFVSNTASLKTNGGDVKGTTDENIVLVAQLTTTGTLQFELNVAINIVVNGKVETIRYVAVENGPLASDEEVCSELKYPKACGCKDFNYLEYSSHYACDLPDACKTPIVLGCTDKRACNYDPNANTNLQDLCCYPGRCNDRDLSIVCPVLDNNFHAPQTGSSNFKLYPNPAWQELTVELALPENTNARVVIYDVFGKVALEKNIAAISGNSMAKVDVSDLASGMYFFRLFMEDAYVTTRFIKN